MEPEVLQILLVEDDPLTLRLSKRTLSRFGKITTATSFVEAQNLISKSIFDVAFFDMNLNGSLHGLDLVSLAQSKNLYSVVLSGESQGEVIKTAFERGAKDYLLKPFTDAKMEQVLACFLNSRKHASFESVIQNNFITKSLKQLEELQKVKNLTISDKPIFLNGETGTGKRIVAHIIKKISDQTLFVELNCSQFTDDLIASELFGHVKGAFTGAIENKEGLLKKADGGIIFLDEIHSLSLKSQKTLLKAIEEKEFYPVGSTTPVRSNFRLLSATCESIHELIDQGKFRQDLFARISTFQIKLMPLRERLEDIELLFSHYISKHLVQVFISDEAKAVLKKYSWPRNTREIEDLVENWIVDGHRLITPEILPIHIRNNAPLVDRFIPDIYLDMVEEYGLNEFLIYLKKELVTESIKRNGGSMRKAANTMGASYSSLSQFLKQYKAMDLVQGSRP